MCPDIIFYYSTMTENQRRDRRRYSNNENDDIDEIEYDVRRTRRNTAWVYRDSSSLTPAQIMEQEVYYQAAEYSLQQSCAVLRSITLLSLCLQFTHNLIHSIPYSLRSPWDYILCRFCRMAAKFEEAIHHVLILMSWIRSYGEMALLYAEDLTVFVHQHNRFPP